MNELLTILSDNPDITVGENIPEDAENLEVHSKNLTTCRQDVFAKILFLYNFVNFCTFSFIFRRVLIVMVDTKYEVVF